MHNLDDNRHLVDHSVVLLLVSAGICMSVLTVFCSLFQYMTATPHGAAYTQLTYPQPQGTPILQAVTLDVSTITGCLYETN